MVRHHSAHDGYEPSPTLTWASVAVVTGTMPAAATNVHDAGPYSPKLGFAYTAVNGVYTGKGFAVQLGPVGGAVMLTVVVVVVVVVSVVVLVTVSVDTPPGTETETVSVVTLPGSETVSVIMLPGRETVSVVTLPGPVTDTVMVDAGPDTVTVTVDVPAAQVGVKTHEQAERILELLPSQLPRYVGTAMAVSVVYVAQNNDAATDEPRRARPQLSSPLEAKSEGRLRFQA